MTPLGQIGDKNAQRAGGGEGHHRARRQWRAGHHPGAGDANGSLGTRHDEKASWTYHDDTRQDAIDKAEDWLRGTKRRIRDAPELAVQADAQESSITVRQLIADCADDQGHTIAEGDGTERVVLTHNRVRRAKNRKGEDVIDKTDNGARPEIVALRGWLGGFTEYSPAIANLWAREITSDDIEDAIEKMGNAVSAETKRRRQAVRVAVGRHAAAAGEPHLRAALRSAKWPAKSALQPGREITHAEWQAIMAHTRRVEPLTLAAKPSPCRPAPWRASRAPSADGRTTPMGWPSTWS